MVEKNKSLKEHSLVIFKSDVLPRAILGKIMIRFEDAGFKLVGAKLAKPDRFILEKHYNGDMEWIESIGDKTKKTFESQGKNIKDELGTDDSIALGLDVKEKLIEYLLDQPIVVTVWEGSPGTISWIRKLVGSTAPGTADMGTIRGDLSHDSQLSAPFKGRAIKNLIHSSGNEKEAKAEISLWFGDDFKPIEYSRTDEIFF